MAAVQESPLPKETLTPSGMQWPGTALPRAEALSACSACTQLFFFLHVDDWRCLLMLMFVDARDDLKFVDCSVSVEGP